VDRNGEAIFNSKIMKIKVQSSQEAAEEEDPLKEEGIINLKFNILIARNMTIMHQIVRIILPTILKKRILC